MTALYLNTKSWLFLIIASAISLLFFNSSPSSTTWFTKPSFSPTSAVKGVAVRDTSRALLTPMMRESFWDKPHEGNIPNLQQTREGRVQNLKSRFVLRIKGTNLAWVSMNLDPLAATKMSQARAISNPAVTANPLMAPIIGLRQSSICTTGSLSGSFTSPLKTSSAAVRSTPEQNDRPDPVNMMTRTHASRSSVLNAWARSTIMGRVNEFREPGRLIVISATPFGSRFTSISFSGDCRSMFNRNPMVRKVAFYLKLA